MPDTSPIRLVALGGLGEFGLNSMVLEWGAESVLVDAGVGFGTAELPGVDSIVPDFRYLASRRAGLRGILLTHGHEDHIGALSFALQAAPGTPVFGSTLTLGFVRRRLRDRGVEADLRVLTPGQPVELGAFRVNPIRVAHSVVDSLALAMETPAGVVMVTRRLQDRPRGPRPTSRPTWRRSAAWGDRGVLALLSDSTNVEVRGRTGAEADVIPAFEEVFARTRGRVLVSCFATAIPRIQRVADAGGAGRRPLARLRRTPHGRQRGRGHGARGCSHLPASRMLPLMAIRERLRRGQPVPLRVRQPGRAASPRCPMISIDEHREVAVGPGDTVVLSVAPHPRQRARRLARDQQPLPPRLRRRPRRHRRTCTSPATPARTSWWR